MAKKTKNIKFAEQTKEELSKFITETKNTLQTQVLGLSQQNPNEKRALRRSIARALTALRVK